MRPLLVASFLLALGASASADLVLSLDAPLSANNLPRYFVTVPTVGTATAIVTGSLVGNTRDEVTGNDQLPLMLDLDSRFTSFEYSGAINAALAIDGEYSGPLFEYTFDAADQPGIYRCDSFAFGSKFAPGDGATNPVQFEIQVQAVPEPATMAALAAGVLAFVRRRRG